MMNFPRNMNSASAEMAFAFPIGPSNDQYHGHHAGMKINDDGYNPSLFSGFYPCQHNQYAANNLDKTMVEELLNPAPHNNQPLSQPLPPALPTQYQNNMHPQLGGYDQVLAQLNIDMEQEDDYDDFDDNVLAPAPAPAFATPNPRAEEDSITLGQCVVRFGIKCPPERVMQHNYIGTNTAALVPTTNHNQIIQTQGHQFPPQNNILSFPNNVVRSGNQNPKRAQEEAMNRVFFGTLCRKPVMQPNSISTNTAVLVPIPNHNQMVQTQGHLYPPQTSILSFTNNAVYNEIPKPKRARRSNPEEFEDRIRRRIIRNRDSAARSRARKLAQFLEMEAELSQLKKENEKLKEIVMVTIEMNKNGEARS